MPELILFLIFCINVILLIKKIIRNEYFHPIFISAIYWVFFLICSILISINFNLKFSWNGIYPIFILLFSFISGSLLINNKLKKSHEIIKSDFKEDRINCIIKPGILKNIIILFSISGFFALIIQLKYLDLSIKSFKDIITVANRISEIRYSDMADMPKYGLFLAAFMYSGAFWGGTFFVNAKIKSYKIISFLPVLVAFIFTIINGVKAIFLFSIIIWISGYISSYVYINKGKIYNIKKLITGFLIISVFILFSIPIVQFLRAGKIDSDFKIINGNAVSYFASYNAFSIWWDDYNFNGFTIFKYSLSGINNIFFQNRVSGLYKENYCVGYFNDKS
ncbi:MAG: O-antigen polymerase, partial [Bacteroidota bacterium]|nr:O-antigen polymerase [Bacteroidota bacterium]